MEISLINVNVSNKRVTSTLFSELLLCQLFLNNNQLKIILMPKRHILGRHIPLSFMFLMNKVFPSLPFPRLPEENTTQGLIYSS